MAKLVFSRIHILSVLVLFHLAVPPGVAQSRAHTLIYNVCGTDYRYGNYTSDSTYDGILFNLLSQMTDTDTSYGFYNYTSGRPPNAVNLISLCNGYLPISSCHSCQKYITSQINTLCPNTKKAICWSDDDCMIRYSNTSILGIMEEEPSMSLSNPSLVDSQYVAGYDKVAQKLMESVINNASAGNSSLKYAYGQADFDPLNITIYSAAQCTPDLSQKDCHKCLNDTVTKLGYVYSSSGYRGARVLHPSCTVRYEEYVFYLTSAVDSPSMPPQGSTNGTQSSKRTTKILVSAIVGTLCLLLIVAASFILIRKRELYWNANSSRFTGGNNFSNIESLQFKFSTVRAATGNFSEANKLGEGGFGAVYKGRLPNNGQEIAVKRLAGDSSQGEVEFENEITLLAKLQHNNLVRLLGFCFHNKERLLTYEFVPNASLDKFLFGGTRRGHLDWETRYKIILGIARGILYLQEDSRLRIVHRDLKASNVLLDAEMSPKIADFGTARLFDIHQTHSDTRRIVGTYGYMAPEYALHGIFSTKSDVYSFGVVLLEIVCGKRCHTLFSEEILGSLRCLIWRKWSEGTPLDVVDPAISDGSESEILRCIHIGLLCAQDNMVDRPTMSSVVHMMSSESVALPLPLQPAYIMTSNMPLNSEDVSWSVERSSAVESITELHVR